MFSTSLSQLTSTITSTLHNQTPTYNHICTPFRANPAAPDANPCNSCNQYET